MTCGIYAITNKINGKHYIGSSATIERRWVQHCSDLKNHRHGNEHLQNAWNKYGKDSFEFSILIECLFDELLDCEQQYLDNKPGYNLSFVAGRVEMTDKVKEKLSMKAKGRIPSEEARHHMSEAQTGRILTEEDKKKVSDAKIGKNRQPFSEEWKHNLSRSLIGNQYAKGGKAFTGHHHTEEAKRKLSVIFKGKKRKPFTEETKHKMSIAMIGNRHGIGNQNTKDKHWRLDENGKHIFYKIEEEVQCLL
jgi:group I intron endonuclease